MVGESRMSYVVYTGSHPPLPWERCHKLFFRWVNQGMALDVDKLLRAQPAPVVPAQGRYLAYFCTLIEFSRLFIEVIQ